MRNFFHQPSSSELTKWALFTIKDHEHRERLSYVIRDAVSDMIFSPGNEDLCKELFNRVCSMSNGHGRKSPSEIIDFWEDFSSYELNKRGKSLWIACVFQHVDTLIDRQTEAAKRFYHDNFAMLELITDPSFPKYHPDSVESLKFTQEEVDAENAKIQVTVETEDETAVDNDSQTDATN